MKIRWMVIFLAVMLLVLFVLPAYGADAFQLSVDGQVIDTGSEVPIVRDGTTFLPLRTTANALKCEVSWTGDFANIVRGDREIQITPGNRAATMVISGQQTFVKIP